MTALERGARVQGDQGFGPGRSGLAFPPATPHPAPSRPPGSAAEREEQTLSGQAGSVGWAAGSWARTLPSRGGSRPATRSLPFCAP